MSPRKSPYKHPVKAHTRKNRPVQNYVRGKGDQIKKAARRRKAAKAEKGRVKTYNATLIYKNLEQEKHQVGATSYLKAVDESIEARQKTELPRRIRLREAM